MPAPKHLTINVAYKNIESAKDASKTLYFKGWDMNPVYEEDGSWVVSGRINKPSTRKRQ